MCKEILNDEIVGSYRNKNNIYEKTVRYCLNADCLKFSSKYSLMKLMPNEIINECISQQLADEVQVKTLPVQRLFKLDWLALVHVRKICPHKVAVSMLNFE